MCHGNLSNRLFSADTGRRCSRPGRAKCFAPGAPIPARAPDARGRPGNKNRLWPRPEPVPVEWSSYGLSLARSPFPSAVPQRRRHEPLTENGLPCEHQPMTRLRPPRALTAFVSPASRPLPSRRRNRFCECRCHTGIAPVVLVKLYSVGFPIDRLIKRNPLDHIPITHQCEPAKHIGARLLGCLGDEMRPFARPPWDIAGPRERTGDP